MNEGKELKIVTPNTLLTKLLILLRQKKDGNNSNQLKDDKYCVFRMSTIKSPKNFTTT